jgi:hypothetical protein
MITLEYPAQWNNLFIHAFVYKSSSWPGSLPLVKKIGAAARDDTYVSKMEVSVACRKFLVI